MNKKKIITLSVIGLILLATFGISVAVFSSLQDGEIENTMVTGSPMFKYTELTGVGNGINIEDAEPVSDVDGKVLTTYFDFKVEAVTKKSGLTYQVVVEPTEANTMPTNKIKMYLTELGENNAETEVSQTINISGNVKTYPEYDTTDMLNQVGKTIYIEYIPPFSTDFERQFRLRMWLADDANLDDGYYGTTGSFRVNVYTDSESELDAIHLTYESKINPDTNLPYTTCVDIQCAIDELYGLTSGN